jgi:hypothetical protein
MVAIGIALPLLVAFGDPTPPRPTRRGHRPPVVSPVDNLVRDPRAWLGPIAVAVGLAGIVQLVIILGIRVQVHERGLAYRSATQRWAVRWDEINDIRSSLVHILGGNGPSMRGWVSIEAAGVVRKVGANVEGIEALRDLVREATFEFLYPPVAAALIQGREVAFGPLVLRRDGIIKGGDFVPWSSLESSTIWEGKLELKVTGKHFAWFKRRTRDVPNVHVLVPAIDHFRFAT